MGYTSILDVIPRSGIEQLRGGDDSTLNKDCCPQSLDSEEREDSNDKKDCGWTRHLVADRSGSYRIAEDFYNVR